ncbi:WD40 repeat-like protein [Delitschia confertaspora ATCC 74209]|uniref:WD40 repeat-like protein n=1 Tax=Delitschia confertaspora ATCC 74209 TaxID=1513339 RepID=A0A9P4JS26_9PLEO|nr:WD40 repeat-like protein [Delitschia confertaspora ATCC 74209]
MHLHSEFPSLRATLKLGGKNFPDNTPWYDVKFYPYTAPGIDAVFVAIGGCNIALCRCVPKKDDPIEILKWYKDDNENAALNSVEWAQAENGDPLVCVAGIDRRIKVINVKTGELVTTLIGHGEAVNDLAICPTNPRLLASASSDHGVRIWSLDPAHQNQPTAVIFFGEGGHKESVLSLGWHRTGRYLLSGGMDTIVNLWVVPENPERFAGKDRPMRIHYPHFSSTDIHTDFVDCVRFYNDLVLSRASKEKTILLWKPDNFSSARPPPTSTSVPIPPSKIAKVSLNPNPHSMPSFSSTSTYSAWSGTFTRLLQFDQPHSEFFYLRLGLFHEWGKRPMLAAGNQKGKLLFWDLQRLEEVEVDAVSGRIGGGEAIFKTRNGLVGKRSAETVGVEEGGRRGMDGPAVSLRKKSRDTPVPEENQCLKPLTAATSFSSHITRFREPSHLSIASGSTSISRNSSLPPNPNTKDTKAKEKPKREPPSIGDPFCKLPPHKNIMVPKVTFTVRQIAWSRGGEWCVGVGDGGWILVLGRDVGGGERVKREEDKVGEEGKDEEGDVEMMKVG